MCCVSNKLRRYFNICINKIWGFLWYSHYLSIFLVFHILLIWYHHFIQMNAECQTASVSGWLVDSHARHCFHLGERSGPRFSTHTRLARYYWSKVILLGFHILWRWHRHFIKINAETESSSPSWPISARRLVYIRVSTVGGLPGWRTHAFVNSHIGFLLIL